MQEHKKVGIYKPEADKEFSRFVPNFVYVARILEAV